MPFDIDKLHRKTDHFHDQSFKNHFGMITVSITCITPLSAVMFVLITFASSTITPIESVTVSSVP